MQLCRKIFETLKEQRSAIQLITDISNQARKYFGDNKTQIDYTVLAFAVNELIDEKKYLPHCELATNIINDIHISLDSIDNCAWKNILKIVDVLQSPDIHNYEQLPSQLKSNANAMIIAIELVRKHHNAVTELASFTTSKHIKYIVQQTQKCLRKLFKLLYRSDIMSA